MVAQRLGVTEAQEGKMGTASLESGEIETAPQRKAVHRGRCRWWSRCKKCSSPDLRKRRAAVRVRIRP